LIQGVFDAYFVGGKIMSQNNLSIGIFNRRQLYPDVVKAVAIILVVFGHNIQFGSGYKYWASDSYFSNPVFIFIYTFHMPLFMLLSGYFFANTVKKYETSKLIDNRFKTLFVPIFMWSLIPVGILLLKSIIRQSIDILLLKEILNILIYNLWFLWAIFFCSILTMIISKRFSDSLCVYIGVLIVLTLLPDGWNVQYYKFMYPFFVVGYFWKKSLFGRCEMYLIKYKWLLFVALVISFIFLYHFYDYECYIYTSGIFVLKNGGLKQFWIDIYRWMIGFVGSAMVLWILYIVVRNKHNRITESLAKLGENSLGIYILDNLINQYILMRVCGGVSGLNYVITGIETIIVLFVCYVVTKEIKKISVLNRLLLGGR
jgi:fucose 4-O-acetylase-like acetyltransferase